MGKVPEICFKIETKCLAWKMKTWHVCHAQSNLMSVLSHYKRYKILHLLLIGTRTGGGHSLLEKMCGVPACIILVLIFPELL